MKEALPERTCLFCRKCSPKGELLRFVWDGSKIVWDQDHRLPGRGGYCHQRVECLSRLGEMAAWSRALKVEGVSLAPEHLKECRERLFKEVPQFRGDDPEGRGSSGSKEGKKRRVRL
jgi:predicted RNA-binding protein YlxR (DUF448 family)